MLGDITGDSSIPARRVRKFLPFGGPVSQRYKFTGRSNGVWVWGDDRPKDIQYLNWITAGQAGTGGRIGFDHGPSSSHNDTDIDHQCSWCRRRIFREGRFAERMHRVEFFVGNPCWPISICPLLRGRSHFRRHVVVSRLRTRPRGPALFRRAQAPRRNHNPGDSLTMHLMLTDVSTPKKDVARDPANQFRNPPHRILPPT